MDFSTNDYSTSQIIKAMIGINNTNISALAEKLGQSRQNLSGKLKRNNFSESELKEIANALGFDIEIRFIQRK